MRPWDIDFCTDILDQKLPFEYNEIISVGGRGAGTKLNLTRDQLVIPCMRPDLVTSIGRGRPLKDAKQTILRKRVAHGESEDLRDISNKMVHKRMLNKLKDDFSWPSISEDVVDFSPDPTSITMPTLSNQPKSTVNDGPKKKGSKNKKKGVLISSTTHRNSFK